MDREANKPNDQQEHGMTLAGCLTVVVAVAAGWVAVHYLAEYVWQEFLILTRGVPQMRLLSAGAAVILIGWSVITRLERIRKE